VPPKKKETKSIADVLGEANKKYANSFTQGFATNTRFLPTGNIALDDIMGGGVPVGRLTQFYGKSQSGKTTAALQTAAGEQQRILSEGSDQIILYMDYECALDEKYAKSLGLDIHDDSFLMLRPEYFETGANLVKDLVETGKVALLVWDSVAAAIPKAVFDEEVGKAAVAPLARLMSPFLGMLNPILLKTETAAIFINHVHNAIGGMPGFGPPQKTRPGGEKLTYYSSVMVEFIATTKEKGSVKNVYGEEVEVAVATETKMVCTKNKVGIPQREGKALVRYGIGFDNFWAARKILEYNGLIKASGAWIKLDESLGGDNINGGKALVEKATDDVAWRQLLIDKAVDILAQDRAKKMSGSETEIDELV
jgi:recombination protein RecA